MEEEEKVKQANKVNAKTSSKQNFQKIESKIPQYKLLIDLINEMIKDIKRWDSTKFHFDNLNTKDIKLILSFFKALLKVGRNVFTEVMLENDPRKLWYKKFQSDEQLSLDQKKLKEEIRRNEHLTALAQLHSSHARGDKIAIWKESREIVDHFYSHICKKIDGKYRN